MSPSLHFRQRGTVVLVALCFVAVLGIALTTYMSLSARVMALSSISSLQGNSAQLAELGMEEALRALNYNSFSGWTSGTTPDVTTVTWSTSGSIASGSVTLPASQYGKLGISGTAYMRVYNYNTSTALYPWNSATSYVSGDIVSFQGRCYKCTSNSTNNAPYDNVTLLVNTSYWSDITPYVYVQGVATLPDQSTTTSSTQLRADLSIAPLFPNAMAGTSSFNLSAGGSLDAYDASRGTYNQTSLPFSIGNPNLTYQAIVASPSVSTNSATTIKGFVATATTTTSLSSNLNLVVKSAISPASPRVDASRVSTLFNIPQFTVTIPAASNLPGTAGTGTVLNTGATSITATGPGASTYSITSTVGGVAAGHPTGIFLNSNTDVLTITGNVILDVTGDLYTNSGTLVINPNSSLTIRFNGELWVGNMSGGGIRNLTLDPACCLIYGTSNYNFSGYHYFWSTIPFYGTIYMPHACVSIWSGVTTYGAISAKSVYAYFNTTMHYDTSLRTKTFFTVSQGYYVTTWRELTDPSERIVLP